MTPRIRQIVLAAHDLETIVSDLTNILGVEVAYRDPQVAEFGLHNALMPIGDQFLEVVAPFKPGTAAGRHLERRGDSAYMIILQTDDLTRDRARFEQLGVRIIWQANHADIRAVHLHPKDIGGAIVSIDQPVPPVSWRWAGPDWQKHPSQNAQRVLAVEIEARDPEAMARRWAKVLGLGDPVEHGDGWRLSVMDGALDFVEADTRGDGVKSFTLNMKAPDMSMKNAQARDVSVEGRSVTVCGTRFHIVGTA
jgi:Glyoxalase-like domain